MASDICTRMRMSNAESRRIVDLVAQHMRIGTVKQMRESKLKRLLREPFFSTLLELHRLDCLASHRKLDLFEFCHQLLRTLPEEKLKPEALLTGDGLIAMGYVPGPVFKVILNRVEEEQLEGRISTPAEAEQFVHSEFHRGG